MKDQEQQASRLGTLSDIVSLGQVCFAIVVGGITYLCKAPLYVSVIVAVVALLLIVFLMRRYRHVLGAKILALLHDCFFPQRDWEEKDKVIEYIYLDRETMAFVNECTIKIVGGPYREIPGKFKWSVGEVEEVSATVTGQKIIPFPDAKKDDIQAHLGYQDFFIKLPKTYYKRDRPFPIGFRCDRLHDPERKATTCLIAGIYRKTNRITMRLKFDKSLNVINIRKLKFADFLDVEPYDCETSELKLDETQRFHYVEFTIRHPIVGAKYAIDWEFQD